MAQVLAREPQHSAAQSARIAAAGRPGATPLVEGVSRSDVHTTDPGTLATTLTAFDQRYVQLSRGAFDGALCEVWVDGIQVFEERMAQAVFQTGAGRPDAISLGVFSVLDGDARWHGVTMGLSHVTCLNRNREVVLSTPRTSALLGVSVPVHMLEELGRPEMIESFGPRWEVLNSSIVHSPGFANLARQRLRSVMTMIASPAVHLRAEAARRQLKSDLVALVDEYVSVAVENDPIPSPAKARRVVRQVSELVDARAGDAITVDDLCRHTCTSRRTLQYCFEQVTGISPAAFLKTLRLHAVRRELFERGSACSIGDVAARWGFWHLSQFSADYKRMFGELPSRTARRFS